MSRFPSRPRNRLIHRLVRVDGLVLLIDIRDLHGVADLDGAGVGFLDAHDQAEEGGLSRTVRADDADDACRRQFEAQVLE